MGNILLDTNILIDWLRLYRRSRPKTPQQKYFLAAVKNFIAFLAKSDTEIFISCHTIKELLQYPKISPQEEERIEILIPKAFIILPTTHEISKIAGLMARQSNEYRNHHIEDCYIASTAIFHKIPLYTRNPADYSYVQHENLIIKTPY
ncbi:MAG: PIN domain-containing protein [Sporomusaceae bacterium]|jgi:predicted nucleic acid-binding protein|nr:PIN domain-containing protein [Sporomusaceae bacterium]